jgi:predicted dehydrogenase
MPSSLPPDRRLLHRAGAPPGKLSAIDDERSRMGLRFGLLGTGYWAAETHGAALASHPDAELVGVWGRHPARAAGLARRYGVRAYDVVDALLADVDAVAVALPPDVQAELAWRAAEAGRHLLLDKPVAFSTADADRIVTAADRSRVASVVFFTNRFQPSIEAFLRQAAERGGWDGARITMFASIFQPGSPYGASRWRRERGGLWDIGPHALSVVLPVLGPVERVTALDGPHDTAHVLVQHRSGAVSTLALSLDAPQAATAHEMTFYGERGVVPVPGGDGTPVQAFAAAVSQLVAAAEGRTSHPCDVRFGRDVVAILEAADAVRTSGTSAVPAR